MIQKLQERILRVVNDPFDVQEFLREKDLYFIRVLVSNIAKLND